MCTFNAEARELQLHADNTKPLADIKHTAFMRLAKRLKRGTYDPARAPRAFGTLAAMAAFDYCKQYASVIDTPCVFPPAARSVFCRLYAHEFEQSVTTGAHDFHDDTMAILAEIPGGASAKLAAARNRASVATTTNGKA